MSARTGVPITAPVESLSDKASGAKLFAVKTNFSGLMGSVKGGLKELGKNPLDDAPFQALCAKGENTAAMRVYNSTVPAGAVVARFVIRQADSNQGDDNDLGVIAPNGAWTYPGLSGSNEAVQLRSPAPGNYRVCVLGWGGTSPALRHKLASAIVTPADLGGNFVAAVAGKAVAGVNTPVAVSWSGLQPNKR